MAPSIEIQVARTQMVVHNCNHGPKSGFHFRLDNFPVPRVFRKVEAHRINWLHNIDTLGKNETAIIFGTVVALDSVRYGPNDPLIGGCWSCIGHTGVREDK